MTSLVRRLVAPGVTTMTALSVALAAVFFLAEPSQAATSRITIGAIATGNGSITTPSVVDHGRARITRTSYRITKGGKTIARASKPGRRFSVAAGTYKMKTVVKYQVGSKKKTYRKTKTVKVTKNSPIMTRSEYDRIKKGMTRAQVTNIVGTAGLLWECDIVGVCHYFFRSASHRHLVNVAFKNAKVVGTYGYPGFRNDAMYDALFG